MPLPKLGYALIVNNVAAEFSGSVADVAALRGAYEKAGFNVRIKLNCSAEVNQTGSFEINRNFLRFLFCTVRCLAVLCSFTEAIINC